VRKIQNSNETDHQSAQALIYAVFQLSALFEISKLRSCNKCIGWSFQLSFCKFIPCFWIELSKFMHVRTSLNTLFQAFWGDNNQSSTHQSSLKTIEHIMFTLVRNWIRIWDWVLENRKEFRVSLRTFNNWRHESSKRVWKIVDNLNDSNSSRSWYYLKMIINMCTNDVYNRWLIVFEMQIDWFESIWFSNPPLNDVSVFDLIKFWTCKHQIRVCC